MRHDLLVARPGLVGLGHEARPQPVRRQPLERADREAGRRGPALEDVADRLRGQCPALDRAPAVDLAEDRAEAAVAGLLPGLERAHRAGLGAAAAGDADGGPLPRGVALAAGDQQAQALGGEADVFALDGDQPAPPQRPGEAEQQEGAVAGAGEAAVAAGEQAADLGGGQRRGLAGRGAVPAQDAAQRVADRRMAGVPGVAGQRVGPADGGEAAAERAAAVRRGRASRPGRRGRRRSPPAPPAGPGGRAGGTRRRSRPSPPGRPAASRPRGSRRRSGRLPARWRAAPGRRGRAGWTCRDSSSLAEFGQAVLSSDNPALSEVSSGGWGRRPRFARASPQLTLSLGRVTLGGLAWWASVAGRRYPWQ
jgi:hypothetical protein